MRILVLGLGNELYGDDGVGIQVIKELRHEFQEKGLPLNQERSVDFLESSLTGFALLDIIIGYDTLIIVDTIKRENPVPGRIHCFEESQIRHIPGPSPHYVSIPQTIQIGRKIGLKVPSTIKIIGIEAKNIYHLGECLSQEIQEAIPSIKKKIKKLIGIKNP